MSISALILSGRRQTNLMRVCLAMLVLFSHSFTLGGFGKEPHIESTLVELTLGSLAVAVFFGFSGYMITSASFKKSLVAFAIHRIARIVPGYLSVLLITSLILTPILEFIVGDFSLSSYYTSQHPYFYVFRNAIFPSYLTPGITGLFLETPFGQATNIDAINGPLWTLPIEVRCYLLTAIFLLLRKFGKFFYFSIWVGLIIVVNYSHLISPILSNKMEWVLNLVWIYMTGSIFALYGKFIFTFKLLAILVISFVSGLVLGDMYLHFLTLGSAPLILLIICGLASKIKSLGTNLDISYGIYIWSWPISQTIILLLPSVSHVNFILSSMLLTAFVSLMSWKFLEKPMILKSRKF